MNQILLLLLQSAYILMPAYFANMAPVIAKKFRILESLNRPIDNGKTLKAGGYIFGKNKTYRGFVVGIFGGIIAAYIQMVLFNLNFFKTLSVPGIDYSSHLVIILLGLLMGFGAILGDTIESFFKRRLKVASGERFIPWDQIDFVIGGYLLALPIIYPYISLQVFLCSVIISFFLHITVNNIAYYLKIRGERW